MNDKNQKSMSPTQSETLSLIKKQFFKTKMCPFQKNKNYCLNESNCHYAHSIDELKPMPDLRNTKLCDYIKKKMPCRDVNCKFAHDIDTLKPSVHLATYKSTICSFWGKGKCFNGNKCRFAHGVEDIKTSEDMDIFESTKYNKKSKNKSKKNISDLKQGTASTCSFNMCDYSINCSLETTNVSSSYEKSREFLMLNNDNVNTEKTKRKSKLDISESTSEFMEETNENEDSDITENYFTFGDKNNSNSIKDVVDKIENMALSTFIENNDKYTKVIKYLLNENNLLKKSIRKDKTHIKMEQDEIEKIKKENSKTKFGCNTFPETSSCKENEEDITQYLFPEEPNDNYLFTNEKKNTNNSIPHFDDTTKIDDNLNSIIKTIDDILISQNVCSFPNVKDTNNSSVCKDIFSVKNNNEFISNEYENLLCNMKSFETLKNIYPSFSSFSIADNKKHPINQIEADQLLEKTFEQNLMNNEQEEKKMRKKNYYSENFSYEKSNVLPCSSNSKGNEVEEFYSKRIFRPFTCPPNDLSSQGVRNMQQRLIPVQQIKQEELKKRITEDPWIDNRTGDISNYVSANDNFRNSSSKINFGGSDNRSNLSGSDNKSIFMGNNNKYAFNGIDNKSAFSGSDNKSAFSGSDNKSAFSGSDNKMDFSSSDNKSIFSDLDNKSSFSVSDNKSIFSDSSNNNFFNNLNLTQNNTPSGVREKNAKLNLRENTELSNSSMNLDKLLLFSNEKSDILKKIRNLISTELQNNENYNYSSKKSSKFVKHLNDNYLPKKSILLNDHLHTTAYNTHIPNVTNYTLLKNSNSNISDNSGSFSGSNSNNNNNSTIKNYYNIGKDNENNGNNKNFNVRINDDNYHTLNNVFSKYKKENNNNQNIWSNNANFNEFAYPFMSHDWAKNQKNNDFFNISKSVNLSSLN
ncbi:zinc finger protein, putative [Plasmodium malariae]|uniref:Zinc finger protein, putative n=1 Tax=Plasmodium malariae TaxID=5858 RepID=A0A1D3TCG9_PLAMA|nr:zinc finger protein, putative [Plasmodium malariae]SCP02555.1 zinc finger protein, putative [Plasmodium malariae]